MPCQAKTNGPLMSQPSQGWLNLEDSAKFDTVCWARKRRTSRALSLSAWPNDGAQPGYQEKVHGARSKSMIPLRVDFSDVQSDIRKRIGAKVPSLAPMGDRQSPPPRLNALLHRPLFVAWLWPSHIKLAKAQIWFPKPFFFLASTGVSIMPPGVPSEGEQVWCGGVVRRCVKHKGLPSDLEAKRWMVQRPTTSYRQGYLGRAVLAE